MSDQYCPDCGGYHEMTTGKCNRKRIDSTAGATPGEPNYRWCYVKKKECGHIRWEPRIIVAGIHHFHHGDPPWPQETHEYTILVPVCLAMIEDEVLPINFDTVCPEGD